MFVVLVVASLAVYFMTAEERTRVLRRAVRLLRLAFGFAGKFRLAEDDPFREDMRRRVRWPLVTYVFVAINVGVLVAILLGRDALGDPATLVAWGGNFAPRTTNGERWRVFTSIFVHRGVLHLLVSVAALAQLGLIVERAVGPFTFGTVLVAAGGLCSVMSAANAPLSVFVGSTGAVFGVYGLLFAAWLRGILQQSAVRIPWRALGSLVPIGAVFVLYSLATDEPDIAAKVGVSSGVVGGIILTRSMRNEGARLRRFAALGAATAAIVLMSAMALRAVSDVRPELAALVGDEERAAAAYDAEVLRFRNGHTTTGELAQYIDRVILPGLQGTRDRMDGLVHVRPADAGVVDVAHVYLRLRQESWRLRAEALRKGNMRKLKDADRVEQSSLRVFQRIKAAPR